MKYEAYFNINNISDHLPTRIILEIKMSNVVKCTVKPSKSICWSYKDIQCYKGCLNAMLSKIDIPNVIQCNNMLCFDNHSNELEQ